MAANKIVQTKSTSQTSQGGPNLKGTPKNRISIEIPTEQENATIDADNRKVRLTNLNKIFWPGQGITKGELIQYYADISSVLLPHIQNRPMVMKRYPNGVSGDFFYMKRAPSPRPSWIATCRVAHRSGNVIDFPMVQDLPALLWIINLGCIDLNPWYSRCDKTNYPDFLHFDLDPVEANPPVPLSRIRETALLVKQGLNALNLNAYAKTSGSRGIHVYVPILRGPTQKQVWTFAKSFAQRLAERHPQLITSAYRVADRPAGRVLIDYNQNAWGRTLASIYSVRARPLATVSTPLTWQEVEQGFIMEDFVIGTLPARIERMGDLWEDVLSPDNRSRLEDLL